MYCTKCGKQVGAADYYCPFCGNQLKQKKDRPVQKKNAYAIPRLSSKWFKLGIAIMATLLIINLVGRLFGSPGKDQVIPTYLSSIERQSFSLLKQAVQPEIASQLSPLASNLITNTMLSEVQSINYDIGDYHEMSTSQIKALEEEIYNKFKVRTNISKAYEVDIYVQFLDVFGDQKIIQNQPMRVYKANGHWYVMPDYSAKR